MMLKMSSDGKEDHIGESVKSHQAQLTELADGLTDSVTTKIPNLDSSTNTVVDDDAKDVLKPSEVLSPSEGVVNREGKSRSGKYEKKFRVKCIKDKNNKYCSQCDLNFITRILFLKHCQEVHKFRFKNKCGTPLLLTKTMTEDVEEDQSMRSKQKSPESSELPHISPPSGSLGHKNKPPPVRALSAS